MSSPVNNNSPLKKHTVQNIFFQWAAISIFAFFIYYFSGNADTFLGIIVIFYGNVFTLWLAIKLFRGQVKLYDSVLVINLCLVVLGLLLASLSMGGYLSDWARSEYWNKILFTFLLIYFCAQTFFVRKASSLGWLLSCIATMLALALNAGLCYAFFYVLSML